MAKFDIKSSMASNEEGYMNYVIVVSFNDKSFEQEVMFQNGDNLEERMQEYADHYESNHGR